MAAKKPAVKAKAATAKKETAYNVDVLKAIVAATLANTLVYVSEADGKPLLAANLIEINSAMVDANGAVAARATTAGVEAVGGTLPTPAASKSAFTVEYGIAIPAQRRGGRNSGFYPFDSMNVGGSFFVPATEARPNVAKSMASTISSANKRYAGERKFSVRNVEENGVSGARIFRTI